MAQHNFSSSSGVAQRSQKVGHLWHWPFYSMNMTSLSHFRGYWPNLTSHFPNLHIILISAKVLCSHSTFYFLQVTYEPESPLSPSSTPSGTHSLWGQGFLSPVRHHDTQASQQGLTCSRYSINIHWANEIFSFLHIFSLRERKWQNFSKLLILILSLNLLNMNQAILYHILDLPKHKGKINVAYVTSLAGDNKKKMFCCICSKYIEVQNWIIVIFLRNWLDLYFERVPTLPHSKISYSAVTDSYSCNYESYSS